MLQALEQEASKYGMSLNFAKSELLVSDPQSDAAMNFANGQPVPITTSVKYLGSVVTWDHPTETAIAARFSIARTALQSIRLVWNSRLPQTTKLYIFHSVVVSSLTYGLNCLTLAHKHFKLIDGYYFRLLRRVLGIPASYISRVSNFTVWQRAGKPTTASQIVLKQQTEILLEVLATPPDDPYHHVIFSSAYRDRIAATQKTTRGRPSQHWLHNMLSFLQEPTNLYFSHHPSIQNPMRLKQLLQNTPNFKGFLVMAPTRASICPVAFGHLRARQE
jgi:hypothetical protein